MVHQSVATLSNLLMTHAPRGITSKDIISDLALAALLNGVKMSPPEGMEEPPAESEKGSVTSPWDLFNKGLGGQSRHT